MKRIVAFLVTLLVLFGNACAAAPEYSFSAPDGFTGADADEKKTNVAERLGMTEDALDGVFRTDGLLYVAVNSDNTQQLRLSVAETEFSRAARSFSRLSAQELETLADELRNNSTASVVTARDGRAYLCLQSERKDSGGTYRSVDYLTVCSAKLYTLHIATSTEASGMQSPENLLNRLTLQDDEQQGKTGTRAWQMLLVAVAIAALAAVAVWLSITVIRDLRKKPEEKP